MRKSLLTLGVLVLVNLLIATAVMAAPTVYNLEPGQIETLEQKIPVNVILVGFDGVGERDQIEQSLLQQLPAEYSPVVRFPQFYGLPGRDMGLRYRFDYDVNFAGAGFADRLFAYLKQIGKPVEPTLYQQLYNEQQNNRIEVTGPVLEIDAPSVEAWLQRKGQQQGYSSERAYTVYFINWYGRDDFNFHVYSKTDEPDPDTGINLGEEYPSRRLVAWGGSHGRTWFYDFSAGPEVWAGNWNVDDADLDGDDAPDTRIPPIWEYAEDGYRAPTELGYDMGRLTRFVAINLLFTTSPLYDPLVTSPGRGGAKIVDTTLFEDNPALNGSEYIDATAIRDYLAMFQPYYRWKVPVKEVNPIDPGAERAFRIFTGLINEPDCWSNYGTPFAQLYCYFDANRDSYLSPAGPNDYVGGVFAFSTTDENMGPFLGLAGFADDNWIDGTQSYMFTFDSPSFIEAGFGFTNVTVHEFGHHIGTSHPHDGYDAELALDYGPAGEFYFVWAGDESASVMSYLNVSNGFGQFDRDNMYRWETAGYLNRANELLDDVLAHPQAFKVESLVRRADRLAGQAQTEFARWRYDRSVQRAYDAYLAVADAATKLGIDPNAAQAQILRAQAPQAVPKVVDWIRFPDQ